MAQERLGPGYFGASRGDPRLGTKSFSWRKLGISTVQVLREGADRLGKPDLVGRLLRCRGSLAVHDGDHVLRQASNSEDHYEWYRDSNGNWVPRLRIKGLKGKAGAVGLQFDPDLSVQWKEHLRLHSRGPEDLVRAKPGSPLVFEASVGDVRRLRAEGQYRFYVAYTPTDDEPFGCAHVSVLLLLRESQKAARDSLRTDLSELLELVHGTPTVPLPEGA